MVGDKKDTVHAVLLPLILDTINTAYAFCVKP
jgi:hypothetical protein